MPELPEVQTITDDLRRDIRDWKVADFYSLWEKNVVPGVRNFKKNINGAKIADIKRKGKYILIELDNENVIIVHLRMTGQLITKSQKSNLKNQINSKLKIPNSNFNNKYIRHYWVLKRGKKKKILFFSDLRKFGTVDLLVEKKYDRHKGLCKLGKDPLSKEFTAEHLGSIREQYPRRTVRSILLDQCLIAGIGNIYVSEILFDAKISPKRKAGKIKKKELSQLCKSIKKVLKKAVAMRGTSVSDYRDLHGKKGSFQKMLKVYNREHERCLTKGCHGVVVREKIVQQSAFWCPKCQK